jgi:hypothetical protein
MLLIVVINRKKIIVNPTTRLKVHDKQPLEGVHEERGPFIKKLKITIRKPMKFLNFT